MKYDFDTVIPRRGTASCKWDAAPEADILPMWVADMDFRTAPEVVEAIKRRAEHGVFGYAIPTEEYYQATVDWFARRHSLALRPEWIMSVTGVVPALSAILRALTEPGDKVLVQTPAYNHFFEALNQNRCEMAENRLAYGGGKYTVDFDDFERKAADPAVKLFLLCNPHNPAGRVWTPEELRRMGEICFAHGIPVVADEIHCEVVMPGYKYTPFAALGEEFLRRSVTCASPSKAFNLAGLQAANIFAPDRELHSKVGRALQMNEVGGIGPFGVDGIVAAYNQGEEWLGEVNRYIYDNYLFTMEFFGRHLPDFSILPLEGTYLVWVDCAALGMSSDAIARKLYDDGRLWVNPGSMYGTAGEGFMRLNIACPRATLADGLERLRGVFEKLIAAK